MNCELFVRPLSMSQLQVEFSGAIKWWKDGLQITMGELVSGPGGIKGARDKLTLSIGLIEWVVMHCLSAKSQCEVSRHGVIFIPKGSQLQWGDYEQMMKPRYVNGIHFNVKMI